jgi:uncharacterized delta-60 repeat protein
MRFEVLEERAVLSAGTLDPSFGTGGLVTTDVPSSSVDRAYDAVTAVQADGKILVAGTSTQYLTGYDFTVARYHSDGTLDKDFGIDGRAVTAIHPGNGDDYAHAVVIQADGKILVAGKTRSATGYDFAVTRYN